MNNFGGGVDGFISPTELEENQCQDMVNCIVRDNLECRTRPGADQIDSAGTYGTALNIIIGGNYDGSGNHSITSLTAGNAYYYTFGANDLTIVNGTQTILGPGSGSLIAQGTSVVITGTPSASITMVFYGDPITGMQWMSTFAVLPGLLLVTSRSYLIEWNGSAWSRLSFRPTMGATVAMAQGVDKVLISDGVQPPQIFDGTNFTAGGLNQTDPPIGATSLCWHAGRMFAAGFSGSNQNSVQGTAPDTVALSNFGNFGVNNWNAATQSFRVGIGDGDPVVAIASMQNFILAVLKQDSVWLVDCNPALAIVNWAAQPQGELVGSGIGCVGRNAWCQYQNDLLFMSQDGVQSLQRMQAAAGQYQLSAPLSRPVQPYIDRINWNHAKGIEAVKYRHLAIFFVPLDASTFNNYALVWNGRIGRWTGVWTNLHVTNATTTLFNNKLQLVMGTQETNVNLWKDDPTVLNTDATYLDNGIAIPTTVKMRSFDFGNLDFQKKLRDSITRFNAGNATISFQAFLDLVDSDDWNEEIAPGGVTLPALLPFTLGSISPAYEYRSLEGLPYCDEVYIQVSSTSGWFAIRNQTVAGFMKPIKTDA